MNPLLSLVTRIDREEEMDAADLPDADYARVLADLSRINRLTLAARPTLAFIRSILARRAESAPPLRVLDVGFGHGDMLRAIARMAAQMGRPVALTGIDLNRRSAACAEAATAATAATAAAIGIRWITGDYRDHGGAGWDVVISSLVAHHMSVAGRADFLHFMEAEADAGWLINDLHRQRLPFAGYPVLATLAMVDPIVRRDGQLSIGRSFRVDEWQRELKAAGMKGATVSRWFPWRLVVGRIK